MSLPFQNIIQNWPCALSSMEYITVLCEIKLFSPYDYGDNIPDSSKLQISEHRYTGCGGVVMSNSIDSLRN